MEIISNNLTVTDLAVPNSSIEDGEHSSSYSGPLDCRAILPIEIWEKIILDLIDDPFDLFACSRVCRAWEAILSRVGHTVLLFPHVIPLLKDYLPRQDVLKCRLVCQKWRKGVDTASLSQWDGHLHQYLSLFEFHRAKIGTILVTSFQVTAFVAEMEDIARFQNPFPNRMLTFAPSRNPELTAEETLDFYSSFHKLGEAIGSHVWRLDYLARGSPEAIRQIPNIFHLYPNLRNLTITVDISTRDFDTEWLENFQMPTMEHLTSLSVYGLRASHIWRAILFSGGLPRLNDFFIWMEPRRFPGNMMNDWIPVLEVLPPVTELKLGCLHVHSLNTLLNLTPWPLKKFSMMMYNRELCQNCKCPVDIVKNCLKLINKFSKTLEELHIYLRHRRCKLKKPAGIMDRIRKRCVCAGDEDDYKPGDFADDPELKPNLWCFPLQVLSLPQTFLHSVIVSAFLEKCVRLREIQVNDLSIRDIIPSKEEVSEEKVQQFLVELWEHVPSTAVLERITLLHVFSRGVVLSCSREVYLLSKQHCETRKKGRIGKMLSTIFS